MIFLTASPILFSVLDIHNFGLGTIYRLAGHIFYHRYCCDMRQCDTKVKFGIYHSVHEPCQDLGVDFFPFAFVHNSSGSVKN